jgi:hypothetical protein
MNENPDTEIISRRRAIWILGVGAAFTMAVPAAVLTASDAEAQTPGIERRQDRRANRRDRREDRRENRRDRREDRRENRENRRENRRNPNPQ